MALNPKPNGPDGTGTPKLRTGPAGALAFLLGAVSVGAFAPLALFPLLWLTLAALFLLLKTATPARAFWLGGAFGAGFFGAGVSWVYVSLSHFGSLPPGIAVPATAIFCALLALYPALAAFTWRSRPLEASPFRQILGFAAIFSLTDWLRGWLFTGFPWLALGYSQSPPSPLAGFAPLVGVYGLSFLTALTAACLAVAASRPRPAPLIVVLVLLCSGAALRTVPWTTPVGDPLPVALVQGNVPQDMKFLPGQFTRTLERYRDLVAAHPARLTLLPETAVPAFLDQVPPGFLDEMKTLAQRQGGDLVFGVATGENGHYWNSAASLGTSAPQIYRKTHLVPFGEFIPPGFSWLLSTAHIPMSDFSRGPAVQPPLAIAGQRVAINICYEDAFGEDLIATLPAAGILANLSNTAWFGDSWAQPQHLQIARLRALETGRPMLRATNTGMTAIIAPDGRISASLPPFTTAVLTAEIRAYAGETPYTRWGNAAFLILAAASLIRAVREGGRVTASPGLSVKGEK